MLKIKDEFYYVEIGGNKLVFKDERSTIDWLVESHKRLAGVKVFKINTVNWSIAEVNDQWWIQIVAEVIRKEKK